MCTAIYWNGLFGRNLDLWCSYGESVVITPRRYPFPFSTDHSALIGMAHVLEDYPLYYEAVNEQGLAMAGLNFSHSATYPTTPQEGTEAVPVYAFIPYLLIRCGSLSDVRALLPHITLVDTPFRPELPTSPLHWLLCDRTGETLVIESVSDGLHVYDDPAGVLTNEPPFPYQRTHLADYASLSPYQPQTNLPLYSGGMGAMGLPGDWSSTSRFVRATYVRQHLICKDSAAANVNQFFHMLDSVAMPDGAVYVDFQGRQTPEKTVYSCCMDLQSGCYYYKTYDEPRLRQLDMHQIDGDTDKLAVYPMEGLTQERCI